MPYENELLPFSFGRCHRKCRVQFKIRKIDPESDKIWICTLSHNEKGYSVEIIDNRYLNILLSECTN